MKIGILTSGNDMLALFGFLQRYDNEYVVWYDDAYFSWGDKPWDLVKERVAVGMQFLKEKGVDCVIVPPVVEMMQDSDFVFPLFQKYVKECCFGYSLVGKIGCMGDWLDMQLGQESLKKLSTDYVLTDNQRAIKKFQFPFAFRGKEVRLWKYLLDSLSWSMPLVNTLVKHELAYFKDAGVDTLIPLNYGYFHVQRTIQKTLNFKKMRFHGIEKLEECFAKITPPTPSTLEGTSPDYSVAVYCTGHGEFLTRDKRLMWLLGRGNAKLVSVVTL